MITGEDTFCVHCGTNPGMAHVPGEIKRNSSRNKFQWLPCSECGVYRWVRIEFNKPISQKCMRCLVKMLSRNIRNISSLGGKATLEKYGTEHFAEMSKKGWAERRGEDRRAENTGTA